MGRGAPSGFSDPERLLGERRRLGAALALAAALLAAPPLAAQLKYLETSDQRLIYQDPTLTFLAPHAARCFENSLDFHRELWDYSPSEEVTILLNDFSDSGNAGAGSVPRNNMAISVAPLNFAYETVSGNERLNWMMNHELVHIASQDQAAGSDLSWRRLFGGKVMPVAEHPETILYFYLTNPRMSAPRWYQEGIATFIETWMAGGRGRAQGPYDEMVFRSMVRDESRFYDPLGLVAEGRKIDFQVESNSYLYGTRFMTYLAFEYSPEQVIDGVARGKGSKRYYADQFLHVFGISLDQGWQEWIDWEREFQRANLETIREYPVTQHEDASAQALGSVSRAHYDPDRNTIYAAFNYPGVVGHIGAISLSDGSVERILDIKDPIIYTVTSLTYDPGAKRIFYTTDNHEYRDLRWVDPETGESATLLKDARLGDLAFNRADRSIWGIRHLNGIATLVRVPHPYDEWQQIHSWPYGEVAYDPAISPDGRRLSASVAEINGRHTLRVWEIESLQAKNTDVIAELDLENTIPANFRFSPDGRFLYGSCYRTGVSNIWRYEVDTRDLQLVTNTDTGFFRPIPLGDDRLIVFRYSGQGFVPARVVATPLDDANEIIFLGQQLTEKHPIVTEWSVGSPAEIDLDSRLTEEGSYHLGPNLRFESIYPVVEGYKDFESIGFRANFSDPLSLNRLHLAAAYTPDEKLPSDERIHLDFEYRRYDWRAFAKLNDADFYDLFGPTKTSIKGYSLGLGYDKNLISDRPRKMGLSLDAEFFGDLERLPGAQNVGTPFEEILIVQAELEYQNLRSSLGHVDDEKGFRWELVAAGSHVNSDWIPSLRGGFDAGFALPAGHSSLWLRTAAGAASGDRANPSASFYFGGFGNNWVDHREVKRYREYYAFPGADLNQIAGKSFAKSMVEWNLPPLRFRSVGTPGFYVTWARTALFAGVVVSDPDVSRLRQTYRNLGIQVDFELTILSRLNMMLSLGYAEAESRGVSQDEFMASLKIL
ncbi:MAG: TolB family protein [Thermoanaerobaculia bacterium]